VDLRSWIKFPKYNFNINLTYNGEILVGVVGLEKKKILLHQNQRAEKFIVVCQK